LSNPALDLLQQHRNQWASESTLIFATESMGLLNTQPCTVITNRFDLYEQLKRSKQQVAFSDFVFADCVALANDRNYTDVVVRIDKEKPLCHHLFNIGAQLLTDGGTLWVVGHKNEGLKTYAKKLSKLAIGEVQVYKGREGFQLLAFKVDEVNLDAQFDAQEYDALRAISSEPALISKPGQYGWKKIDQGSKLLMNTVASHYKFSADDRVLDLGCGYGYLSVIASMHPYDEIIATDNNAASIASATANFESNNIKGSVVAADCAKGLEGRFNLLLCNPPFHTGFSHDTALTEKFARTIASRLRRKGKAYIVVNQFIAIAPILAKQGLTVEELDLDQGYRILLAHR